MWKDIWRNTLQDVHWKLPGPLISLQEWDQQWHKVPGWIQHSAIQIRIEYCYTKRKQISFHRIPVYASVEGLRLEELLCWMFIFLPQHHSLPKSLKQSESSLHIVIWRQQWYKMAFHMSTALSNIEQAKGPEISQVHKRTHEFLCKKVYDHERQTQLSNMWLLILMLMKLHASIKKSSSKLCIESCLVQSYWKQIQACKWLGLQVQIASRLFFPTYLKSHPFELQQLHRKWSRNS